MARKTKQRAADASAQDPKTLLHHSHLSPSPAEESFVGFELALHHIMEAFSRWSSALHEYVSGENLPVQDVSILQMIRMNDKPKSAVEIGRFLNREDSSNILYTLRKLERAGLIEKSDAPLRQTTYQVTDVGREVTDRYAEIRRELLLTLLDGGPPELDNATNVLWRICSVYEQCAKNVAIRGMLQNETQETTSETA
jgi:predicted MarR family transcription regulator